MEEKSDVKPALIESESLQKIREQAYFIESVTNTLPGVITITSHPSIEIIFSNRDALELLGFDTDEIIAMGHKARKALIVPEDVQGLKDYYTRFDSLADKDENRVEFRIKNKKGELIWLDVRGRVFGRDEKGRVIQTLHIAQDVTDRKKAAQEILRLKDEVAQRATDKYHTIIDSIDEGFCLVEMIFDEEGNAADMLYLEVNKVFQQQTGLGNVIGRRLRECIPDVEQHWIDFFGKVALTGQAARMEYYVAAIGRWFSCYASRVVGENDRQLALIFDDISGRKRYERQQDYLLKLSDVFRSMANPAEVVGAVTRIAMEYFNADRCFYCEIQDENVLISCDSAREGIASVAGVYSLKSFALFKKVVDEGRPFVVYDAQTADILDEPLKALCAHFDVISFIDVPVIKNGKAVGILCVVQSVPVHWTDSEIDMAVETADRLWSAVEHTRAIESLRISEAWLQGQKLAFQAAMSGLPLAESLGVLVNTVVAQTAGNARAAFYMVPAGAEGLHHIVGMGEAFAKDVNGFKIGADSLSCGLAMYLGEPVITPDVELEPRWEPWLAKARLYDIRGSWSFPVRTDGGPVLGTFAMYFKQPREPMPRELELAGVVAHAAAIIMSRHIESTERTQAEAALRKSDALLASVFKVLPVGLGFVDTQGKFLLLNEEMRRFVPGRLMPSVDEDRYSRWEARNPDGSLIERHDYPGARALRGDPIPNLEMLYLPDEGEKIWTRVASIPYKNEHNEIVGAVTVITDINELKHTEAELKKSEQQLKALLKQKDEFIANASHELKTPVTSIKAYAGIVQDMLKESGLNDESKIMHRLNEQIDRLTVLISYLLDTTNLSEGKLSFRFQPLQINELLKERIEELGRTTTHRLLLQVSELPLVTADKERMGQVISNLLSNAIKYSPDSSTITIATAAVADGIQVSIQDEGFGISEEDQQKIFERFYRVTANNLDTYPGMGLGLYISSQIIQRHGGTIEVKSMPGKGAEFVFTLPVGNTGFI